MGTRIEGISPCLNYPLVTDLSVKLVCLTLVEGGGVGFPDLMAVWRKMDMQEIWNPILSPTPPPGYEMEMGESARSGKRSGKLPRIPACSDVISSANVA